MDHDSAPLRCSQLSASFNPPRQSRYKSPASPLSTNIQLVGYVFRMTAQSVSNANAWQMLIDNIGLEEVAQTREYGHTEPRRTGPGSLCKVSDETALVID